VKQEEDDQKWTGRFQLRFLLLATSKASSTLFYLLCFAVLARRLDPAQYGVIRFWFTIVAVSVPVFTVGLSQSVKFLYAREFHRSEAFIGECLLVAVAGGTVGGLLLAVGSMAAGPADGFLPNLFRGGFLFSVLYPATMVGVSLLVNLHRVGEAALISLLTALGIAISWVIGSQWNGWVIGLLLSGEAVAVFLLILFLLREKLCAVNWRSWRSRAFEIARRSWVLALAGILGVFHVNSDKLIVWWQEPAERFAIFANGAFEIPLIGVVTGSIFAVLTPRLSHLVSTGREDLALGWWREGGKRSAMVLVPVAACLFFLAPELIELVFTETYRESVPVFRIYLLMVPFRVLNYGSLFLAMGRSVMITRRVSVALACNVILTSIAVHQFGYVHAATTSVLVMILEVGFCVMWIARRFRRGVVSVVGGGFHATLFAGAALLFATLTPVLRVWVDSSVARLFVGLLLSFLIGAVGLLQLRRSMEEASEPRRTRT